MDLSPAASIPPVQFSVTSSPSQLLSIPPAPLITAALAKKSNGANELSIA